MTLREWMDRERWSGAALAGILSIHRNTVSNYRNGKQKPKVSHILKIHRLSHGAVTFNDFYADELLQIERELSLSQEAE